jgi:hypothetical protein
LNFVYDNFKSEKNYQSLKKTRRGELKTKVRLFEKKCLPPVETTTFSLSGILCQQLCEFDNAKNKSKRIFS